uniref:Putative secreted protein n=1 Tax=Anopheles darlingi TaxID=43151 RepID=A0A2M4D228_ANODA
MNWHFPPCLCVCLCVCVHEASPAKNTLHPSRSVLKQTTLAAKGNSDLSFRYVTVLRGGGYMLSAKDAPLERRRRRKGFATASPPLPPVCTAPVCGLIL